jgi:trans-feruloyl-CoA hydratase/vanillin synthase
VRAQEAANFHDDTEGRKEGIRQFIDEKSYKPGFAAYDRSKAPAEKPKSASTKARAKV